MTYRNETLNALEKILPPIVARKDIEYYLGGLISRSYLACLDSKGKGPKSIKMQRRVAYLREDLLSWLNDRLAD